MAGLSAALLVVEVTETEEQAELLRGLGYRHGQGYLYSRPVPPGRISTLRSVADVERGVLLESGC